MEIGCLARHIITLPSASMSENFYSSNGVDRLIAPYLPAFGYAVEVGANNGTFGSNAKHFEDKGWIVLCIEPNPLLAAEGKSCRKLWLEVGCGSSPATAVDFKVVWNYPYGSFSGMHTHEVPPGLNCPPLNDQPTIKVNIDTLDHILAGSGFPRLDLLTIDVEGHELEVLKGINLDKWRPKIIVAEAWDEASRKDIENHLAPFSYVLDQIREYDCCFGRRNA